MASNTTDSIDFRGSSYQYTFAHASAFPSPMATTSHEFKHHTHDRPTSQKMESEKMACSASPGWKGKTPMRSIWPSPEDEVNNAFASPLDHQVNSPEMRNTLPSFSHMTQGPSPSTSPRMAIDSPLESTKFFSPRSSGSHSNNGSAPTLPGIRDLQLYPSDDTIVLQPLFPASRHMMEQKKATSTQMRSNAQPKQITRRQMKRTPEDSAITRAPWPATKSGPGWYGKNNCWGRVKDTSIDWLAQAREEFDHYHSWNGPGPASQRWADDPLPSKRPSLETEDSASVLPHKETRKEAKRKLSMEDTDPTPPQSKRQRAKRSASVLEEHAPTVESPERIVKKRKPAVKIPKQTKQAKPSKAASVEPDVDYQLYPAHAPELSTLDKTSRGFTIAWSQQKPISLSGNPDLHLLHEKEIKLCEKLCLYPARYVYVKRRFLVGYIRALRRGAVWNINAAQHACRGDDRYGKSGLDVNKIGALFRAFDSVGWHEPSLYKQWIDCNCHHPICVSE